MNQGWGPDAQYIAEGIIAFVETGFSAAYASAEKLAKVAETATSRMESLAKAMGRGLTAALTAPARAVDMLVNKINGLASAIANSGIGQLSRIASFGGALGIGGLLFGAGRGSQEMSQFTTALQTLTNEIGDKLAPYVRMATQALSEMTAWWRRLDNELKTQITRWAVIGTVIATTIALLPTFLSIIGAIVAAVGTLVAIITSPFTLFIAALTATVLAVDKAFGGDMVDAAANAAKGIVDNTKTWTEYIVESLGGLLESFGKFWNQIMEWSSKAATFVRDTWVHTTNHVARILAAVGEGVGALPAGTRKALNEDIKNELAKMKPIEFDKIDIGGIKPGMGALVHGLQKQFADFGDALKRIKGAGAGDFGFSRGQAQWEGLEDVWLRAQKSAAETTGGPVQRILDGIKDMKNINNDQLGVLRNIEKKPGAVIP